MGTNYSVKVLLPLNSRFIKSLPKEVASTLDVVNSALSNWKVDSELSVFNVSTSTKWEGISQHFYSVMQEARTINNQTNGRFDVTLSPLINLWGFGPNNNNKNISAAAINVALQKVGHSTLIAIKPKPPSIKKQREDITINLSAIAKGYAVDQVALLLKSYGIENFVVEIGGDLKANGVNINGESWRVGIEKPSDTGKLIQLVIFLNNMAIATSGDYRKFFIEDGVRMSHIIDPVSGYPVTHNLASVSVISVSAMRADGLATALFVLGEKEGIKLANKLNVAAYFITRNQKNYRTSYSHLFNALYLKH